MSGDLDTEKLKDGLKWLVSGALGLACVVLFFREVFFSLSVTGRAATLLLSTVLCLVATATWRWKHGTTLLGMVFLLLFLVWVSVTHSGAIVWVVLTVGVFVMVTYQIQNNRITLTTRGAMVTTVVFLALFAGIVAVDARPQDIEYEIQLEDSIAPSESENARSIPIGSVTFRNQGHLREEVAIDATACIYTGAGEYKERSVLFGGRHESWVQSVGRKDEVTFDLEILLNPDEAAALNPATVERGTSCPQPGDYPRLVVVVADATGEPVAR